MTKEIKSLEEMEEFAFSTAKDLRSNSIGKKAVVLGLFGDLGSGKTTFTQSLAKAFGIKQIVTSPTFVIEKIYKLPKTENFEHLIHIDAYRLEGEEEMLELGWETILNNPKNIIVIEWPERIEKILPKDMQKIFFEFVDENTRKINYGKK